MTATASSACAGLVRPVLLVLMLVGSACSVGEETLGERAWDTGAAAPTPRTEVSAAADSGRIYISGGFVEGGASTGAVEIYDVEEDFWSSGPPLPLMLNHAMSATLGGEVYVVGGYRGPGLSRPSNRAFVLRDGAWEELAPMPEPRAAAGAASAGGLLFVVGGVGPNGLAESTLLWDPARQRWAVAPGPAVLRQHLGVTALDGFVYAVGGRTGGLNTNLDAFERFDVRAARWERLPDLPTARGGLAAASGAGLVVAVGGEAEATFSEVEAFDVGRSRWRALPQLLTPRHGLGVVTLGSKLYVVAGGTEPGLTFSRAIEVLDLRRVAPDRPRALSLAR